MAAQGMPEKEGWLRRENLDYLSERVEDLWREHNFDIVRDGGNGGQGGVNATFHLPSDVAAEGDGVTSLCRGMGYFPSGGTSWTRKEIATIPPAFKSSKHGVDGWCSRCLNIYREHFDVLMDPYLVPEGVEPP